MLNITDLKKSYGSFHMDCSLNVPSGCITGLIGANGAGKTTLLKAVLGLISIDGGRIELFGKDHGEMNAKDKQDLGVVLSDSGFSGFLTLQNLLSIQAGLYTDFEKDRFLDNCRRYELPMQKPLKEFSTGMKAKVKILTALSHRANLLILDEPTAGLDVLAREELLHLLREYMVEDESRSILISSHIATDLEGFCDDLYMIHDGKIVLHEETDALLGSYALLKVTPEQYAALDKAYLLRVLCEPYGYCCLTAEKQFYMENYPQITVERGSIDHVITLMVKGEAV